MQETKEVKLWSGCKNKIIQKEQEIIKKSKTANKYISSRPIFKWPFLKAQRGKAGCALTLQ